MPLTIHRWRYHDLKNFENYSTVAPLYRRKARTNLDRRPVPSLFCCLWLVRVTSKKSHTTKARQLLLALFFCVHVACSRLALQLAFSCRGPKLLWLLVVDPGLKFSSNYLAVKTQERPRDQSFRGSADKIFRATKRIDLKWSLKMWVLHSKSKAYFQAPYFVL